MKIVTICGSLKFQKEMMFVAQRLSLKGICVLTPAYPVIKDLNISDEQLKFLKEEHLRRIELADSIFVINKDDYLGESTLIEIEHAKKLKKEIKYYTDYYNN